MARGGDRRARARSLSPGRSRHRGPIGCEWAIHNPDRVLSLTALDTMLTRRASAVPGRCGRSRSAASASSGCGDAAPGVRGPVPPPGPRRPRAMTTAEIYAYHELLSAPIAAAPSCGSCGASSSRRRSSGSSGEGLADLPPGPDHLGRATTRRSDSTRCGSRSGCSGSTTGAAARQALPPGGPGAGARVRDRRPVAPARLAPARSSPLARPLDRRRGGGVERGRVELDTGRELDVKLAREIDPGDARLGRHSST